MGRGRLLAAAGVVRGQNRARAGDARACSSRGRVRPWAGRPGRGRRGGGPGEAGARLVCRCWA